MTGHHVRLKIPDGLTDAQARGFFDAVKAWLKDDIAEQRAIADDTAKPSGERRYCDADLGRISVLVAEWDDRDIDAMIERAALYEDDREVTT